MNNCEEHSLQKVKKWRKNYKQFKDFRNLVSLPYVWQKHSFVHKFPCRRSHWQQHSHIWRDYPLFHHTTESTEKKPFCLSLSFDPSLRLLWMTIIFFWQKKKLWRRSRDIFFTTLEKYFSGNTGFFAKNIISAKITIFKIFFSLFLPRNEDFSFSDLILLRLGKNVYQLIMEMNQIKI